MSVLALDLGTKTGFALQGGGAVLSGTVSFDPAKNKGRFSGGGMRYLKMQRWLDEVHESAKITEVVFEEVRRHKGVDAAHVYGGYMGCLTAWCEANGIPYEGVPVGDIKAFLCGKRSASKEDMIAGVKSVFGHACVDDNEADAYALLKLRIHQNGGGQ